MRQCLSYIGRNAAVTYCFARPSPGAPSNAPMRIGSPKTGHKKGYKTMMISPTTAARTAASDTLNRAADIAKLARASYLAHVTPINRATWGCPKHDELLHALGRADQERARAGIRLNRLYRPT